MVEGGHVGEGHAQPQLLAAEIPSAETSNSDRWKPVTLYDVRITAVGRREVWTVYRRYSKFYDLRVQLQKRFPSQALPPIPPKRLIGKEDRLFIEQRRQELEEFLNALLREPVEISLSEEVCFFLEVPEPLRLCLLETDMRAPALLPIPGEAPRAVATGGGAPDESRVTWLLTQLHDLANTKVLTIRTFEDWILRTKPPLTEANVQLLYLGLELQGGLLEEVGAFEHSDVSSIAALGLLCKLLSHEHCAEAPLFRAVLRRLDLSVLARMRLQHHIHRNRGQSNRLDAFHVLRSLELAPDRLAALLQDDFALREFRRWQEVLQGRISFRTLHRQSVTKRRTSNTEPSGLLARPALSGREYRTIAESAFTSVQMCLRTFVLPDGDAATASLHAAGDAGDLAAAAGPGDATGGAVPAVSSTAVPPAAEIPAGTPSTATPASAASALEGHRTVVAETPPRQGAAWTALSASAAAPDVRLRPGGDAGQKQWRHVPCPDSSWRTKYGMTAAYQHVPFEQQSDAYIVRAAMRLPFPALLVACLLSDHRHFIREALALKQQQLPGSVVTQLDQIAEGQLISQLHSTTIIESLALKTEHEAYSELVECNLGTPSAPHVAVRLWLLKSLRIIPAAVAPAGEGGEGGEPQAAAPPPSYLFLCTAVQPVTAPPQQEGAGAAQAGSGAMAGGAPGQYGLPGSRALSPSGRAASPRLINLKPSGVLVQPAGEDAADISFSALLGKDSVKLVSGDLLGERLLFWRSLENLVFVLEHLCPLPACFSHPLMARQEHCLSAETTPEASEPASPKSAPGAGAASVAASGGSTPDSSPASRRSVEVELVEDEGSAFS